MPRTPGTSANFNGADLESFVENILQRKGYTFVDKKKFEATRYLEQPIYTKQFYIGRSIYDTPMYSDLILYHPEKHPNSLAIEVKWQQSSGSVDEKFPFLVLNIKTREPYPTVILLDGGGYKIQAEKWLKNQVDDKLIHVFNMREFQTWSNKENI